MDDSKKITYATKAELTLSRDLTGIKVWVVWHRIYEEVLSVHWAEESAQGRITALENKEESGRFEYDEFEIEP